MTDRACIKLYRQAAWHERNNPFVCPLNVLLDNKKVDSIQPEEEKLLSISIGEHSIVVKAWLGAGSKTTEINLLPGVEIFLECGWSPSYVKGVTNFVIAGVVIVAIIFFSRLIATKLSPATPSHLSDLFFGGMIVLFLVSWSSAMLFGLIGMFKPGWIFYLKESK